MSIEKRNLTIMWFANFLVAASATMVLPFLSLYLETFGNYDNAFVQRWSGYVFGITFLVAFFISPVWGRVGDKYGFKPILLITGYGISLSIFMMGFVDSVMGLFLLRMAMGAVTGFIPTSLALISSQTPKEIAGKTLGTLQMGTVSGGLFGPVLGGVMADSFGFSYTFIITSIAIALAATGVLFGIQEVRKSPGKTKATRYSSKQVFQHILRHKLLFTVMVISFIIQVANFSVQPLLALYVDELTATTNIAFLAGLAFSATGVGNLLATRKWGKLGDEIGYEKVLSILLILACIFIIPQALADELWQLILFRFLFGIAIGGMIPSVTAYIRQEAPLSMQGEVLGYNQSFRFLGNVAGPVLGGILSGFAGISSIFYITGALFLAAFGLLWWSMRHSESQVKEQY
ncbi:multidrug efflux MFS transporter [Rossellomorea vietnamensis]|uniref:Multidrug efflux MFS transporter n=1 Tax=Rossellomorea vietnamensis TaxID=218284 RepID=A0A5D4K924_9BACI|nr:MFS transporter [Rossellomorea vietnamensis]TYR73877.1 multidrug efflux MFS transporter [Rossellomorea vietnamensis]